MSTVVVARRDEIVAIGADTLTKNGSINVQSKYKRKHSKIIPVGEGFFAYVGRGIWQQALTEYLENLKPAPDLDSIQAVYRACCAMHGELKKSQFLHPEEDEFEETGLQALLANPHGIFGIFPDRSVLEFARFYAFGSGVKYALGAMHRAWHCGEPAQDIVRAGVEASAEFDEHTALPLESHTMRLASKPCAARRVLRLFSADGKKGVWP